MLGAVVQIGMSGLAGWKVLEKSLDQRMATFAKTPQIARELEYFKANIGNVKTAEDLTKDFRLFRVALTAYGLESQSGSQALMKRVLGEDLSDPSATANKMVDPKFKQMAQAFSLGAPANEASADTTMVDDLVTKLIQARFTEATGKKVGLVPSPAMQDEIDAFAKTAAVKADVAYFREKIVTMTSVDKVMEDKRFLKMTLESFGLKSMVPSTDLVRKVLSEDPTDDSSLAANLSNKAYKDLATAFSFARDGRELDVYDPSAAIDKIVDRYAVTEFTKATGIKVGSAPSKELQEKIAAFAETDPAKERIAQFRDLIQGVESADDVMGTFRVYQFALKAYDLESFQNSRDLMSRVFREDPADPASVVNRTSDPRLKEMAEAFSFISARGDKPVTKAKFVDSVVDKFLRNAFEETLGQSDSSMRVALYAQRKLPEIKSAYEIISDEPLRTFVFSAAGIATASAQMDADKLKDLIEKKIDMGQLKDPAYVTKLTEKYVSGAAVSNTTGVFNSAAAVLIAGQTSIPTIGIDAGMIAILNAGKSY